MNLTDLLNFIVGPSTPRIFEGLCILLAGILAVTTILFLIIKRVMRKRQERIEKEIEEEERKREIIEIKKFLFKKLLHLRSYELKRYIEKLKSFIDVPIEFCDIRDIKVEEAYSLLRLIEQAGLYHERNIQIDFMERNLEELKEDSHEIYKDNQRKAWQNESVLRVLKTDEKNVYKKSNLNKKQIQVLLENGFKHGNEFCACERRVLSVLVKPPYNQSVTHTFLVWSIKKLLKKISGVKEIKDYDSANADITFKFNHQTYAIEVETGDLPRKKEQMNKKLKYLNRKYSRKWFFVVSHRKFLRQYKEYAPTTTRNQVREKLRNLLKI